MKLIRASIVLLPRLVRFRDVSAYLGMDRNRFNAEVRPYLTSIPIGQQGLAFDRLELDAWVEDYISRNGRRPKAPKLEDDTCQNVTECRGSAKKAGSGKLKSAADMHQEDGSEKARAYLLALRQRST
jgi:predicted DNA-binding transcriptional regulator AlpA